MPIYSYNGKRGKSYFFKFGINGAYYLRRGFKTKKAALEAEKDFKNKLLGDCDPWKVIVRLKFKDIVNKYVEYCFSTMNIRKYIEKKEVITNEKSKKIVSNKKRQAQKKPMKMGKNNKYGAGYRT